MKIEGIQIDGFGLFYNLAVTDIPSGLSVFYGCNEAGKSTLLAFIRNILFGFPDGRSKVNPYLPVRGGLHGGRLLLRTSEGALLTVERFGGRRGGHVTVSEDGVLIGNSESLRQLMSGTTREVFKNVYAFSLGELQTLETLQGEYMKSAIYGASSGSAIFALPNLESRITLQMEELFKPNGNSPLINVILKRIEEIRHQLKAAIGGISEYNSAVAELESIENDLKANLEKRNEAVKTDRRLELLERISPDWQSYLELESELQKIPNFADVLAEDGLITLDKLASVREDKHCRIEGLTAEIDNLTQSISELLIDENILAHEDELSLLIEQKGHYAASKEALLLNGQKLDEVTADLNRLLSELGPDWDESRVKAIDRSLFSRERILQFSEELSVARTAIEKAEAAADAANNRYEAAKIEEAKALDALLSMGEGPDCQDDESISAVLKGRDQYAADIREIPYLRGQRELAKEQLEKNLRSIDPNWTEVEVRGFDASIAARERLQLFEMKLQGAEKAITDAKAPYQTSIQLSEDAGRRIEVLDEQIQSLPVPEVNTLEELVRRKGELRALRHQTNRYELLSSEITHKEERRLDKQQESMRLGRSNKGHVSAYLLLFAVVFLAAGLVVYIKVKPVYGLIAAGLAIPSLAVYIRVKLNEDQAQRDEDETALTYRNQIQTIEFELADLHEELSNLADQMARSSSALSLAGTGVGTDFDGLEAELDRAIASFERRSRLVDERLRAAADYRRAGEQQRAAQRRLEEASLNREKAIEEWDNYLSECNLRPGTSPSAVALIFNKVDALHDQLKSLDDLDNRIRLIENSIQRYRGLAGSIPFLSSLTELEDGDYLLAVNKYLDDLRLEQQISREREMLAHSLSEKRERSEEAEIAFGKTLADREAAINAEKHLTDEWISWLTEQGFDLKLSPTTALAALQTVDQCVRQYSQRDQYQRLFDEARADIAAYEGNAYKLFTDLGVPMPEREKLPIVIAQISKELEQSKSRALRREEMQKQLDKLAGQRESLDMQRTAVDLEIAELLSAADCTDIDQYRTKCYYCNERRRISENMANIESAILKLTNEPGLENVRRSFEEMTQDDITLLRSSASREIAEIDETLEYLRRKRSELLHSIENMSSSDDISKLRADEEIHLERLRSAAKEWSKYAIANKLLREARRRFEEEHQPKVVKDSSGFFTTMTNGRYTGVIAPIGEETIEALSADGKRYGPESLSRGTLEQLYLSLRFGYIKNHNTGAELLPVIMDDILVNFDPDRTRRAVDAILQLAEGRQVIYFTCHPETLRMFSDAKGTSTEPWLHIVRDCAVISSSSDYLENLR